ncbi:hypothetical protein EVAR_11654_1 [Eumeta japonica]|uniref:Uncharacterized protein n=1 Tax=Eumeta variegata TaxID=151549 RepID=A0A4C1WVJ1_EUMVA|nr:hypothetical protein EVAR_11654_1 [Eumeta japonica]
MFILRLIALERGKLARERTECRWLPLSPWAFTTPEKLPAGSVFLVRESPSGLFPLRQLTFTSITHSICLSIRYPIPTQEMDIALAAPLGKLYRCIRYKIPISTSPHNRFFRVADTAGVVAALSVLNIFISRGTEPSRSEPASTETG